MLLYYRVFIVRVYLQVYRNACPECQEMTLSPHPSSSMLFTHDAKKEKGRRGRLIGAETT